MRQLIYLAAVVVLFTWAHYVSRDPGEKVNWGSIAPFILVMIAGFLLVLK